MTGAQAGNQQGLLGLGGGGLFQDALDSIEVRRAVDALPANGAEVGQQVLARGLDVGDGAGMLLRRLDQVLRAAFPSGTEIQMVADQMEERSFADKRPGAVDGVP